MKKVYKCYDDWAKERKGWRLIFNDQLVKNFKKWKPTGIVWNEVECGGWDSALEVYPDVSDDLLKALLKRARENARINNRERGRSAYRLLRQAGVPAKLLRACYISSRNLFSANLCEAISPEGEVQKVVEFRWRRPRTDEPSDIVGHFIQDGKSWWRYIGNLEWLHYLIPSAMKAFPKNIKWKRQGEWYFVQVWRPQYLSPYNPPSVEELLLEWLLQPKTRPWLDTWELRQVGDIRVIHEMINRPISAPFYLSRSHTIAKAHQITQTFWPDYQSHGLNLAQINCYDLSPVMFIITGPACIKHTQGDHEDLELEEGMWFVFRGGDGMDD